MDRVIALSVYEMSCLGYQVSGNWMCVLLCVFTRVEVHTCMCKCLCTYVQVCDDIKCHHLALHSIFQTGSLDELRTH